MKIGKFDLDAGKTFIVAELSANHNGSLQVALDTIDAAKEVGADAIKLQTYTADTLTLNCDKDDFIVKGGTPWDGITLHELYQKAYTPWEWHEELFAHARKIGIDVFSSPFDKTAVDFLEKLDPSAYKIASFEIVDHELVRYAASKGKPIIMSTGIAEISDIQDAVEICRQEGNENIMLLKCTSAYPAPLDAAHLRMIPSLANTFGVEAGFSDHTKGITAPVAAVVLGAKMIEKHFIIDRSIGGPDSSFSLDVKEFKEMVDAVREAEQVLGEVDYTLTDKARSGRQFARSLYISRDVKAGEVITEENIRSSRPGYGLHPKHLQEILGKVATRDLEMGERASFEMFTDKK